MLDSIKMTKKEDITIISTKIEFRGLSGRRIRAYHDTQVENIADRPFVVISPGYGETKRDYISTAYYLVSNGFSVLRYDCLNHLGESDGDIINFKLSDVEESMLAALEYVQSEFSVKNMGMVASSLSGRVAFKIAPKNKKIAYIVALTSVFSLKDTLISLYKEDLLAEYKKGKRWGALDMLGFEVKDDFLEEAIKNKYEDLQSTVKDIKKIDIPICYLTAGNDVWVRYEDAELMQRSSTNKTSKVIKIPGALHQIQENPKLAKIAILRMVETCLQYDGMTKTAIGSLKEPPIRGIAEQNKEEIANLKNAFAITKTDEKNFWVDYLSKYFVLIKSRDYQNLLSLVAQLFGEVNETEYLLDAGCGNGHFGAWLLCNMEVAFKKNMISFTYTGMDFAETALSDARNIHRGIIDNIYSNNEIGKKINFNYILADLEEDMPLENNSFDKICCNLVISYIQNPLRVLKNLNSKLKSNGKIVVSSLKPYSDLSLIYKDYLDQNPEIEDILEGRKLLSSAGKIRHKEKQGYYHFYDEKELTDIMEEAGFLDIKVYRSFGNQANVAWGRKP